MATTIQIRSLIDFGNKVQNEAVRDLDLLRRIETTIDSLDSRYKSLSQADAGADQFIRLLQESTLNLESDEGNLVDLFERARDSIGAAYQTWSVKHLCAINAPELSDDDCVVEAYAQLLTVAASLHDKLNTLSWIIGEQQAEQDRKLPGSFTSASDLFSAMGV